MTKLYDIHNYPEIPAVPLYIKDDGVYVLEGDMIQVEITFHNKEDYKGDTLDEIAWLMGIIDHPEGNVYFGHPIRVKTFN